MEKHLIAFPTESCTAHSSIISVEKKKNQETKTSIGVADDCCWRRSSSDTAYGSSQTKKWMGKQNFCPSAPDSIATHGIMGCRR